MWLSHRLTFCNQRVLVWGSHVKLSCLLVLLSRHKGLQVILLQAAYCHALSDPSGVLRRWSIHLSPQVCHAREVQVEIGLRCLGWLASSHRSSFLFTCTQLVNAKWRQEWFLILLDLMALHVLTYYSWSLTNTLTLWESKDRLLQVLDSIHSIVRVIAVISFHNSLASSVLREAILLTTS